MRIFGCSLFLFAAILPNSNGCSYGPLNLGSTSGASSSLTDTGDFGVNGGGVTTCTVTSTACSSITLQVAYGAVPGNSGATQTTTESRSGGSTCDLTLTMPAASADATVLGISITSYVSTANVALTCSCNSPLITPSPTASPNAAVPTAGPCECFSGVATVQVESKGSVPMKDLRVGDKVLTGTSNQYQSVYAFGHRDKEKETLFYQIYTDANDNPLEMTGSHLVYVAEHSATSPKRNNLISKRADQIEAGDLLVSADQGPVTVTAINTIMRKGIYMPLTQSGKVVVDGILSSCYVSIEEEAPNAIETSMALLSEETILHLWLSPIRMLCMGVSPAYCNSYNKEGILSWLDLGRSILRYAEQQSILVQVFLLGIPHLVVFGLLYAVETMLGGPALAPIMALGVVITITGILRLRCFHKVEAAAGKKAV